MRPFDYLAPDSLAEAVAILEQEGGHACILAGGTDLLVEMKGRVRTPACLVDIKRIPGLNGLRWDPEDGLRIGALTTVRQVETSPLVAQKFPALAQAAASLGSVQIRNRATVAGNICRASPSADTPPPLIAAGAALCIFGPAGERQVPLEAFSTGPGRTVLAPGEIVTAIVLHEPPAHTGQVYLKLGRRAAMELATVGVAASLTLVGRECVSARVVLGAVAPTAMRAHEAEQALEGRVIDEAAVSAAAEAAMAAARPISDVRSTAAYRREMVRVLTARAIRQALAAD